MSGIIGGAGTRSGRIGLHLGIKSVLIRLTGHEETGVQDPVGGASGTMSAGSGDWEIADDTLNEDSLNGSTLIDVVDGEFFFKETGHYQLHAKCNWRPNSNAATYCQHQLYVSTNNGDAFTQLNYSEIGLHGSSVFGHSNMQILVKVTSVSGANAHAVKIRQNSSSGTAAMEGSTSSSLTYIMFTKLADI